MLRDGNNTESRVANTLDRPIISRNLEVVLVSRHTQLSAIYLFVPLSLTNTVVIFVHYPIGPCMLAQEDGLLPSYQPSFFGLLVSLFAR